MRLVAALLVVVTLIFGVTAFRVWKVAREDHRDPVDAILVLGAAQFDGRPSKIFEARLRHASKLYEQRVAPVVVTLGGGRAGDRFTEAEAGARFLATLGVPAADVRQVREGGDTVSSLRAAARDHPQLKRVVLVSDPWHGLRARSIASDAGFTAQTSPARTGPAVQSRGTEVRYIARETLAYLHYKIFRRGRGSGPNAV